MSDASTDCAALQRNDTRPIYQQIKDLIRAKIDSGEWSAGERLPSEHEWVAELEVSRMTVNRALRELAHEGVVQRVHGVGTFVAEPVAHASLIELRNIADEIAARGGRHRAHIVHQGSTPADSHVAARMEVSAGTMVSHITLVHYQNEQPIQIEDRYVNHEFAPHFLAQDFAATTPTQYLLGLFRPDEMEHIVRATLPDQAAARRLHLAPGEPCLQLQRRTWKDGQVVTCATLLYPGSRYDLVARYSTAT